MKSAAQVRALVEAALGPSFPSPFVLRERYAPELVLTGLAAIDALAGGLPRSCLTEISGPPSSGRTTLELALLASLTTNGEACALIDAEDAFDPASAQAAGVVLDHLLWVRCHGLEQALRAADLLLGAGGFGAVVLDLADVPARRTRRVPLSYWFRFRRAVENTPTVLALIDEEPCAKSSASLVLRLEAEGVEWTAAADEIESQKSKIENLKFQILNSLTQARHFRAHARLLRGIRWRAEVVRNRNPKREIRDSKLETRNLELTIRNSELEARNPKLEIRNPKLETRNPKLVAVHHSRAIHDTEVVAQIREPVMLNPLTIPLPFDQARGGLSSRRLQTVPSRCSGQSPSEAKELRINSAKHPGVSAFPSETNAGILRFAQNEGPFEFPVSSLRISNLKLRSSIVNRQSAMKMTFACLYIATFPVQAVVRLEPELRGRAVIIVEPEPPPSRVFALNEAARKAGAECGMSQVEAVSFKGVEVRRRSQAAEASAHAALLDLARSFSPRFEDVAVDTVVLDLAGLEALLGTAEEIAQQLSERAHKLEFDANVALAPNPDAARLAARGWTGITLIGEGEEANRLGELPVEVLGPPLEMQETLERWGIRTFGALAALPAAELSERLGQEGIRLQRLARGGALRALIPAEEPLHFEEAMDLDYLVAEIEPLAFILGRLLNQLCARLAARGRATQELRLLLGVDAPGDEFARESQKSKVECQRSKVESTVTFRVEGRESKVESATFNFFKPRTPNPESRALRLPVPTQDSRLLLKLWLLELQAHPPSAPVLNVAITAEPTWPRVAQGDLFLPRAPDPQKLGLTLARIRGVVGDDKAGSPELLDTHRPDAFRMNPFEMREPVTVRSRKSKAKGSATFKVESRKSKVASNTTFNFQLLTPNPEPRVPLLLRLFRPSLAASVEVQAGHPVRVDSHYVSGRVMSIAGPWRKSGGWWTDHPWKHDEWDVEIAVVSRRLSVVSYVKRVEGRKLKVERARCYRLFRDLTNGQWFVGGVYD